MKKYLGMIKTAAAAALGALLFAACMNLLDPPINRRVDNSPAEGKGAVRIETGSAAARTAIPEAVFDHYEFTFFQGDNNLDPMTSPGEEPDAVFKLAAGDWSVTVRAFVGEGPETLAAEGSADFTVEVGEETPIEVKLSPAASEGTGILNFTLRYPATAMVKEFTLTRLADETPADLTGGPVTDNPFAGTRATNSGYYLARAGLAKDGISAEKTEVVHIYKNMTTELELDFYDEDFRAFVVASSADSGPGTLRQALADSPRGATILIDLPEGDRVITLTSGGLAVNGKRIIEGNGVTLIGGLSVSGGVNDHTDIRRIHFKGGGIYNNGAKLTVESCIFSGIQGSAAIRAEYSGTAKSWLAVRGCTFFGNSGGSISFEGAKSTLVQTGNVSWASADPVTPPVSPISFKPLKGSAALGALTPRPAVYPVVDFYGEPIPETNAATGAVQTPVEGDGFVLDYGNAGIGEVSATGGTVDADGLITGEVTFTASNGLLAYWTINGVKLDEQPVSNPLVLDLEGHTTVRGVFHLYATSPLDDGPGSLREALTKAAAGETIYLAGQTITLASPLALTKNVVIEGNGATLTQRGIAPNSNTQLLRVSNGVTVRISRIHFTGGRATQSGAAINSAGGNITLESCIFSDNQNTDTRQTYGGGAIFNNGSAKLTVLGCTFYGNSSGGFGGAIYRGSGGSGGYVKLTGNVFYGNTAPTNSVAYGNTATINSYGFNVSDKASGIGATASGWIFYPNGAPTDKQVSSLSFSIASFRPIADLAVADSVMGVITTRPADYPETDFYGDPIPATNAAAGAVQTAAAAGGSYMLNYAALGPGTVTVSGAVDANGFTNDSSVTLTAVTANGIFNHWTIGGVEQTDKSPVLVVTMDGHKIVRAVFGAIHRVTSSLNDGPGSLREALTNAKSGDKIIFDVQTVTLSTALPTIGGDIVIEGNGATLTQNGALTSPLLSLLYTGKVRINRLHFKGGFATNSGGGAISGNPISLSLESCIFSDNISAGASYYGGAVAVTGGILNVSGCVFYENSANGSNGGGAISFGGTTATLTGNVFWGNTAASYPVVRVASGALTSGGFNVSDKADGTGATASGWTFAAGDKTVSSLPISSISFKPIKGLVPEISVEGIISAKPEGYPETDFHGIPIPAANAAAGAVQTATGGTGYVLDYVPVGPGMVEVSNVTVDADGLTTGAATLTAQANPNGIFEHWTINGEDAGQSLELAVTMDGHKTVRAVFSYSLTVVSALDNGPGTLREVLGNAYDGGTVVLPEGETITLSSPLPQITTNITIEGNGATLTQNGFTASNTSQLLRIASGKTVSISRIHFTRGRAVDYGAAIDNRGTLTLESCVFTDNATSVNLAYGGAIYTTTGSLTVLGCTFYGNAAGVTTGQGGAIHRGGGTLTMTGNIFWANTATQRVVYGTASITSGGYNVSDKKSGTGNAQSGWVFVGAGIDPAPGDADKHLTNLGMTEVFEPYSTELPGIPLPLEGFPELYFDGTPRGSSSTPGAMPADDSGSDPGGPDPGTPPSPARPWDYSTPPSQPAGIKTVPGMKLIYLSWFPAARAESYEVYYSTGTSFEGATKFAEEPTEPSVKVTGLEYSTLYNFWVQAKNQSGTRRSNMFTATWKTSDPVPWQLIYRGAEETRYFANNGGGDWYSFWDQGDTYAPDERYRFFYGGMGTIKYVGNGVIIHQYDSNGTFLATFGGTNPTTTWPFDSRIAGEANGYTSGMGNNQFTTTLEEALNKFAVQGGAGRKGGGYEYITTMAGLSYIITGDPIPDYQIPD
jgi:hypothetical protein